MDRRPLFSRFGRLPTFVWRAMKEAHAVVIAIIASLTWTAGNYLVPWLAQECGASVSGLSTPIIVSVAVLILLTVLGIGGYLVWEEESFQHQDLKGRTASLLAIKFAPAEEGFLQSGSPGGQSAMFIRVLPTTLSRVDGCVGYLEKVFRRVNGKWESIGVPDRMALHWSSLHEQRQAPVEQPISVIHDSPQFLDVAVIIAGQSQINLAVDYMHPAVAKALFDYAGDVFKFVLRVIGDGGDATIALQMRRTRNWDKPEVIAIPV